MEVATETAACVAAKSDGVAGFDILVGFYKEFGEVTVDGLKAVGVTENHVVAVALALEVGESDTAIKSGAYGIAGLQLEVDTFVHTAETGTIAVGRGHIAGGWHHEVADVDNLTVGNFHAGVGIDTFGFPTLGVDVHFGFFLLFEKVVDKCLCLVN